MPSIEAAVGSLDVREALLALCFSMRVLQRLVQRLQIERDGFSMRDCGQSKLKGFGRRKRLVVPNSVENGHVLRTGSSLWRSKTTFSKLASAPRRPRRLRLSF